MQQHALIVGGTSGIGLATAQTLQTAGLKVTIAGRDAKRLSEAAAALGAGVQPRALDAADEGTLKPFFTELGPIDHLVLALGSSKGGGGFSEVALADVKTGFAEKVFPHFACAQAALPTLSKNGSITFISAVTAVAAMKGTAGLGAANAAIANLVPILASELRPLRVNSVAPGVIDTPWWDFLPADQKQAVFANYAEQTPVGRVGLPEDIAGAISFLITNTFMTGQTIVCDGGIRLAA